MLKRIINQWIKQPGYNCICCSPTNKRGLHLEFWEDGDEVVTFWNPDSDFQSWINTLHGGIQAMLLDEVSGWTITRKLQTTGVTSKMEVQYIKPVTTIDGQLTVRAHIAKQMRNVAFVEAVIINSKGETCTKGTLTFFCASQQKAKEAGFEECRVEE